MNEHASLKDHAAVIGVGNTAYGSFPETDEYGLAAPNIHSDSSE